ncbi:hypothetical protein [Parasphingorhabdus sp.]|uniref:hypothetical protein n=1 Tax=Parasphingorhabdus sp. TaxID=2709688 RepID=UPI0032650FE9
MPKLRLLLLSAMVLPLLSGCVAALLPIAAAGVMGKTQIDRVKAKRELVAAGATDVVQPAGRHNAIKAGEFSGQGGGFDMERDAQTAGAIESYLSRYQKPIGARPFAAYTEFANYALSQAAKLEAGEGLKSSVLVPRVAIEKPQTVSCAGKPLAVLIDLDDKSEKQWLTADTLYWQQGLPEAVSALRAAKVSVIWLSDQPATASDRIAQILSEAGLSAPEADDFLFLDRGNDDRKQARRWDAARAYCIVASAGDSRSDFDELYDYLRNPDGAITLEYMFGAGWFVAPTPLVASPDKTMSDQAAAGDEDEG